MSHFADELKELRLKRGLTQTALAKELQVTQNAVFNWENGKREPSIEMIEKIADYFQVSASYLFAEKESYRIMLRFLDELSKGKAPAAIDFIPVNGHGSAEAVPEAGNERRPDFVMTDEDGIPFATIEFTKADKSYDRLIAFARKCYEWYQKTYESLNEEGRCKVAEYAEILSASERYRGEGKEHGKEPHKNA